MNVVIVFEPEARLKDPDYPDSGALRQAEWLPDGSDVLVIWRERVNPDDADGFNRTHMVGQGIWENVTLDQLKVAIEGLEQ